MSNQNILLSAFFATIIFMAIMLILPNLYTFYLRLKKHLRSVIATLWMIQTLKNHIRYITKTYWQLEKKGHLNAEDFLDQQVDVCNNSIKQAKQNLITLILNFSHYTNLELFTLKKEIKAIKENDKRKIDKVFKDISLIEDYAKSKTGLDVNS
jgi:branched-subunit amino acid ABC-type transport system permease component